MKRIAFSVQQADSRLLPALWTRVCVLTALLESSEIFKTHCAKSEFKWITLHLRVSCMSISLVSMEILSLRHGTSDRSLFLANLQVCSRIIR